MYSIQELAVHVSNICAALRYAITALEEVRDGRFRYNMGDYEGCAKGSAFRALNKIEELLAPAKAVDKA